jgi:DNA transposition AAA+ family ATPase
MNADIIKAAIAKEGISQSAIARYLGVSSGAVGHVIGGYSRSSKIEAALEALVGQKIFPPSQPKGRRKTVWNGPKQQETA